MIAERELREFTNEEHPAVIVMFRFPSYGPKMIPHAPPIIKNLGRLYHRTQLSVILSGAFKEIAEERSLSNLSMEIDYNTVEARQSVDQSGLNSVTISANLRYKADLSDTSWIHQIHEVPIEPSTEHRIEETLREIKELLKSINQNLINIRRC